MSGLTKHAQEQITMNAFNDEIVKIATADILGYTPDWDNLTDEDIEKIAKIGDGKFMKWLGKGVGKAVKGIREGNIGQGVRQMARGIGGTLGIQTKAMKESGKDYSLKDVIGGGLRATVGGAVDVAGGVAKGIGNTIEQTGKMVDKGIQSAKEGFQEGQGELNLKTPGGMGGKAEVKTDEVKADAPEVKEVKTEEVKTPEVKTEEVKTPEVKTEEVKTPEVKTEEVKTPEVKTEEVKTPEVKTEEVKTDSKKTSIENVLTSKDPNAAADAVNSGNINVTDLIKAMNQRKKDSEQVAGQ